MAAQIPPKAGEVIARSRIVLGWRMYPISTIRNEPPETHSSGGLFWKLWLAAEGAGHDREHQARAACMDLRRRR